MCGIAGILGNADMSVSGSMAARLSHRGPDGFGGYEDVLPNGSIFDGKLNWIINLRKPRCIFLYRH